MKKLFDAYGEYIPGFFRINIEKRLFEGINIQDFSKEEMATFIHEYIHFLQDLSTTRGISNFVYVSQMLQLNFANAYRQQECISLPIDLEECGVENAYENSELQSFYGGSDSQIEVRYINCVKREKEDILSEILNKEIFAINVYHDNMDIPYILGNTAIAESMAYLVESTQFGGCGRKHEFPYNACEMICETICPSIENNKKIIVAICELSLMHEHSGDMFWYILQDIKQKNLQFKTVNDFEKYFYERTFFLYENMVNSFYELKSVLDFLFPKELPMFATTSAKVYGMIRKGFDYRKQNKLFISEIMELQIPIHMFLEWVKYFGMPIICDMNNDIFIGDDDLMYMFGPFALYNFFMSREDNKCDMSTFCKKQRVPVYDECNCYLSPWRQAENDKVCLFGLYWTLYSLSGKEVKRKKF